MTGRAAKSMGKTGQVEERQQMRHLSRATRSRHIQPAYAAMGPLRPHTCYRRCHRGGADVYRLMAVAPDSGRIQESVEV